MERADLVTEMREIKHYYTQGLKLARELKTKLKKENGPKGHF